MIIDIGKNGEWKQINDGDIFGTLSSSFNLDLDRKKGKVVGNRSKEVFNTGDDADFGLVTDIVVFDHDNDLINEYVVRAGGDGTVGGGIFFGDSNPSDTLTENTDSGVPTVSTIDRGSLEVFNNKLYATDSTNIKAFAKGASSWTTVSSGGLSNSEHQTTVYANRLYIADDDNTILSLNTSETLATLGNANTLTLEDGYYITCLISTDRAIYIGAFDERGGLGKVFEWDGEDANTVTTAHTLDTIGVLSGVVKNGVPYFLDVEGKLLALSGGQFVEVARLPFDKQRPLFDAESVNSSTLATRIRYIHPNGMALVGGNINMLVNTAHLDNAVNPNERCPSGIWEYTEENGLYHKNSVSYSDAGGTDISDYGQFDLSMVGALSEAPAGNTDADRNGTYLFGAKYYTNATSTTYGYFTNDTLGTTLSAFYFVTPELRSEEIMEGWNNIYAIYKKMANSTDKIVLKYRTQPDDPQYFTGTWSTDTAFTSTDNMSSVSVGDEVQILRGEGAGISAHITDLSEAGGTYTVTIDESISGMSGTLKFKTQAWTKIDSIAEQVNNFKSMAVDSTSPSTQFKLFFLGKGDSPEFHRLISSSKVHTPVV